MHATQDHSIQDLSPDSATHNGGRSDRRVDGPASRSGPAFRKADERFAEMYLEIARLLLAYGKTETARRRLKRVVDDFGNTSAGVESRNLLISIEVTSLDDQPPQANCPVETGRSK
jgi:hypothetical protein